MKIQPRPIVDRSLPVVALVGRPNVGKSTLFNRLTGSHYAIVEDQQGLNPDRRKGKCEYDGRLFRVVDTGGIDFGAEGSISVGMRRQADLAIAEADVVLLIVDGKRGLLPDDYDICVKLRRAGKTILVVANKIDGPRHEDGIADLYGLGGASRREYAILGDAVNTAARFMQAAGSSQYAIPILCDSVTQQSASSKLRFSPLEPIQLKGKSEAVSVFNPMLDLDASKQTHHATSFVGRAIEKQILHDALLQASKEGDAHIIVLEGEAGIGKSRLVEYLQEKASEVGASYFACNGDADGNRGGD